MIVRVKLNNGVRNKFLILCFLIMLVMGTLMGVLFGKNGLADSSSLKILSDSQNRCVKTYERYKYFTCMTESLESVVRRYGVGELVGEIKKSLSNNDGMIVFDGGRNCHELMHAIGRSAGKYADNVKKEILECDPVCGSGCYHGIMESMLDRTASNFESVVTGFCSGSFEKDDPVIRTCFHGLGHSVANYKFDEAEALKVCDKVDQIGQVDCAKGVFMELYHVVGLHAPIDTPFDKQGWCSSQVKKYQAVCWQLAGGFHNGERKNDFLAKKGVVVDSYEDEAIYYCALAPELELVSQCYELMGLNLYNVSRNGHYGVSGDEEILRVCSRAVGFMDACIRGAISGMFESDPSGKEGERICRFLEEKEEYSICIDDLMERRQRFEDSI